MKNKLIVNKMPKSGKDCVLGEEDYYQTDFYDCKLRNGQPCCLESRLECPYLQCIDDIEAYNRKND